MLVNHVHDDHVGVVERAEIGDDRKGRALVRFGESARAEEIWRDVVSGIRRHVSVGAHIHAAEIDNEASGEDLIVIRITRWEPVEISLASVPADTGAGIGRTREGSKPMSEENHAAVKAAREEGQKALLTRVNEILAIGKEYGVLEMAQELVTTGKTTDADLDRFKKDAVDAYFQAKQDELERAAKDAPSTSLGLSEPEKQRYSISRAINAMLENDWSKAGFERECSREIEKLLDKEARGLFVPHDIQTRAYTPEGRQLKREMTTGGTGTGAELVGTMHDWGSFIEQLRNEVVVIRAGATMLPGLRQNLDIPEKDGNATFAWLAESGGVTLSDLGTGTVSLTPKTVGGGVKASRRMMKQSLPAIDDLIMMDLAEGAAETIDLGALEGSAASNQPRGVVNQVGVNTQIVNPAGQPTWSEVVGFETALGTDNALRGRLAWITTSAVVGFLKTEEKSANTGRYLLEAERGSMFGPQGTLNSYPLYTTNALTAGAMIFGNWAELLIGMWGVLDIRPDPYTAADEDAMIIRAFQDIDIAVRHPVSFCKNVLT